MTNDMKKVTGIGGIFFKSKDPAASKRWYEQHLGIVSGEYGAHFEWLQVDEPERGKCYTAWNPFREETNYFDPGSQEFMVNYRVDDLESLLVSLREDGVVQVGQTEYFPYGKFAWILDCDGRKIELWEPVDRELGLE